MNSRAPMSRNTELPRARACARERISGFSFLDFGHITCSRSRPVTEIFREKKRAREEEKEARLLDGFCDSSHFHERSAEFIIGVTSPAHFVAASSCPPLIYTSELSFLQISHLTTDLTAAAPEMSIRYKSNYVKGIVILCVSALETQSATIH